MRNFKISSSKGYLIVNSTTGIVIGCNSYRSKYNYLPQIEKFDLNRFKTPNKLTLIPEDVDILRFAY